MNDKLSVKVNSISQVKQISNEHIQDYNYHTNLTKLGHEKTTITTNTSPWNRHRIKNKEVESQTKKLGQEEIITHTTENIKNKRKKNSTDKYRRNIRVQHFKERIEEIVAEEIRSIRNGAKQKEHNDVTKEVSNSQLQKETLIEDGQRKEQAEKPKYSDRSVEINRTKQSNYNGNKTEDYHAKKEQQDPKSENWLKYDKCVETGVQCGYCQRWLDFKYERTTKEKVLQEYPEEIQYIYKKDKVTQEERIWESKYKTTLIELEELKDRY